MSVSELGEGGFEIWKQIFTGNKSLPQKIVNNRDCVIQSWLSAYVVRDFIYFYANVQLMKRNI